MLTSGLGQSGISHLATVPFDIFLHLILKTSLVLSVCFLKRYVHVISFIFNGINRLGS